MRLAKRRLLASRSAKARRRSVTSVAWTTRPRTAGSSTRTSTTPSNCRHEPSAAWTRTSKASSGATSPPVARRIRSNTRGTSSGWTKGMTPSAGSKPARWPNRRAAPPFDQRQDPSGSRMVMTSRDRASTASSRWALDSIGLPRLPPRSSRAAPPPVSSSDSLASLTTTRLPSTLPSVPTMGMVSPQQRRTTPEEETARKRPRRPRSSTRFRHRSATVSTSSGCTARYHGDPRRERPVVPEKSSHRWLWYQESPSASTATMPTGTSTERAPRAWRAAERRSSSSGLSLECTACECMTLLRWLARPRRLVIRE